MPALCIWFIHDHRLGHQKQLQGLASRLEAHARIQSCWLNVEDYGLRLKHLFMAPEHLHAFPRPDLIIGAGHKTHLSVLLAARYYKAFSVLIMKPSLPLSWFDAIICPEHDRAPAAENILSTFGPLSTVIPPDESNSQLTRTNNLILLGGPSRHFCFDTRNLIDQIEQLCRENPQTPWLLSNSPRTPPDALKQLRSLKLPNLKIHEYQDDSLGSLNELLCTSNQVWLTPDSMSMIFEAITAGAKVGVFHDRASRGKAGSRINKQIQALIGNQVVTAFNQRKAGMQEAKLANHRLWETDRAARWLLQLYANHLTQIAKQHA